MSRSRARTHIEECLSNVPNLSTHSVNIILGYLEHFPNILPRGLEISPVLADLVLERFDNEINNSNDVIYYSRFVDDIVIITTQAEDKRSFLRKVRKCLPDGIELNHGKMDVISISNRKKSGNNPNGKRVGKFNYLGYKFSIIDSQLTGKGRPELGQFSKVVIDISDKKIKQFQTKISKALIYYSKFGNFELLESRIKFLTTNRDLVEKSTGNKIPTGIYYNYNLLSKESKSVRYLDKKLRKFVISYDHLFNRRAGYSLSLNQKRDLLKCSFVNGFNNRIYKKYTPYWLMEITRIWR